MGDKFQAYTFLKQFGPDRFICTNFSANEQGKWKEQYYDIEVDVYSPDICPISECHSAIFLTGSFDANSPHIPLMKSLITYDNIKHVIIWGGFHGVSNDEQYIESMSFLNSDKITYFGRGYDDVAIYNRITASESVVGGDPMIYYPHTLIPERVAAIDTLGILSVYLFECRRTLFDEIVSKCDMILFIDTYADRDHGMINYLDRIGKKYAHSFQPEVVLSYIRAASHVYTSRLHGAILSIASYIPTIIISSDGAEKGVKSVKFHNIDMLCPIDTTFDDPIKTYQDEISTYINTSMSTFSTIMSICDHTSR